MVKRFVTNNFSKGRQGYLVRRIILHTYDGRGTSLFNWFNNPESRTSAHYAVFKNGTVEQYVKENNTAWHAGTATNSNRPNNNLESIGIEHQDDGRPSDNSRTEALYEASAKLIADICERRGIPVRLLKRSEKWESGISLHNYYAARACPGGLDANRIVTRAAEILTSKSEESEAPSVPDSPAPLDDYYRVNQGNIQLGAFYKKANAFNFWYHNQDTTVTRHNTDITFEFKREMNELEVAITNLKNQVSALQNEITRMREQPDTLVDEVLKLREQIEIIQLQLDEKIIENRKLRDKENFTTGELLGLLSNRIFRR